MAAAVSLPTLLNTLTDSLTLADSSVSMSADALLPPPDGISLLDTKNDLLLSYLQNIVLLIILKLKNGGGGGRLEDDAQSVHLEATKKLVESRVYLEKGVRALESRLKYQIDKVLRAADAEERSSQQCNKECNGQNGKVQRGTNASPEKSDAFDVESTSAYSDEVSASDEANPKIDDLSYRPNPLAFFPRPHPAESAKPFSKSRSSPSNRTGAAYQPPRITPVSMPEMRPPHTNSSHPQSERRNRKSYLLDEYINTELSSAPLAEPSIGSNSTILKRGRGALSTSQREKERARTEYEEANFSRLPKESSAERKMARIQGESRAKGRDGFGGEDWRGLGDVGDRVARSLGKGEGQKRSVLERRQKRRRVDGDVGDGGRGIGESFEMKRRLMEGRAARKRKAG